MWMAVEDSDSRGLGNHGVLHLNKSGVGFVIDPCESTKGDELTWLIELSADMFCKHVLKLGRVLTVAPDFESTSSERLPLMLLFDLSCFDIKMRKSAASNSRIKVGRPLSCHCVAKTFEKVLSVGVCRMQLEDTPAFLVFESSAGVLTNPDVVMLQSSHILRRFAPVRRVSGFDAECNNVLLPVVVSFAVEEFNEILPCIGKFIHRLDSLLCSLGADMKESVALSSSAKERKESTHVDADIKLRRLREFLKFNAPHPIASNCSFILRGLQEIVRGMVCGFIQCREGWTDNVGSHCRLNRVEGLRSSGRRISTSQIGGVRRSSIRCVRSVVF